MQFVSMWTGVKNFNESLTEISKKSEKQMGATHQVINTKPDA